MIYQNIILSILVVLVFLLLVLNMLSGHEIAEMRRKQREFDNYQKEINEKMVKLHKNMSRELQEANRLKQREFSGML